MKQIDPKVRTWIESSGWKQRVKPHEFCPSGKWEYSFGNEISGDVATHLYFNPPLDSPAVKNAVLDGKIKAVSEIRKKFTVNSQEYKHLTTIILAHKKQIKELKESA